MRFRGIEALPTPTSSWASVRLGEAPSDEILCQVLELRNGIWAGLADAKGVDSKA
jgi:hypothetical protein